MKRTLPGRYLKVAAAPGQLEGSTFNSHPLTPRTTRRGALRRLVISRRKKVPVARRTRRRMYGQGTYDDEKAHGS